VGIARKLKEVDWAMDLVTTQEDLAGFLNNIEDAHKLNSLVEDVRYALMDYQVCAFRELGFTVLNICPRPRCSKISMMRAVN